MQPAQPSFSPGRKWSVGFSVTLAVIALLACVVMINFISSRHYHRWDSRKVEPLSPRTIRVLKSVTNTVSVIVYYDRRDALFNSVSQLLNQYKVVCPKLDIQFVDYRYPGRAEKIRAQYKLGPDSEENRIIFDSGKASLVVSAKDLSIYDYSKLGTGEEIPRTGFKGEQLFTSAIFSVLEARQRQVYFLQGHGEHDPKNDDQQRGYSKLADLLERNNLSVLKLQPLVGTEIPNDCQILIVPGPTRALDREELDKIDRYLSQGGRMFVLFNYFGWTNRTGLEGLLAKWNVEVGANFVQDATQGQAQNQANLAVNRFGGHPVVSPLLNSSVVLILPRTISQRANAPQSADAPKVVELAFTSTEGSVVNRFARIERQGAIPLMAAIEKGSIQGLGADKGAARIVVAGDSFFLSNLGFDYAANEDFASLAVNWLLNREMPLGEIAPSAVREYKLVVTERQFARLRLAFLAGIPGGILFLGFFVWLRRRS